LDGDADILVYFYISSLEKKSVDLINGDKILSLFVIFIKHVRIPRKSYIKHNSNETCEKEDKTYPKAPKAELARERGARGLPDSPYAHKSTGRLHLCTPAMLPYTLAYK